MLRFSQQFTEASRDQIELLELHKDGIVVAEYWTTLPPKAELQARIQEIHRQAQERIVRRQLAASAGKDLLTWSAMRACRDTRTGREGQGSPDPLCWGE